jgi:predicted membrane channel-forming protein YqfA (hemolysin III family)
MESPSLPFVNRYKAVFYSLILIIWWIGVWGIADTMIHLVFKGNTLKELGVYIGFVTIVLVIIFIHPELLERM